jgi:hypothetical protein
MIWNWRRSCVVKYCVQSTIHYRHTLWICLYIRSLVAWERTHSHQPWHAYALKPGRSFRKVKAPKVSWVRVLASVVSVPGKLSTTEQRHQDQICLFRRDHRTKATTPKICPAFELVKMFSVTMYVSTIEERNKNKFFWAGRIQTKRSKTWKLPWVRVPVKMFGLRIILSYDIQRYISMIRLMISFRAIKINMRWKHLSNFAAVTLQALC